MKVFYKIKDSITENDLAYHGMSRSYKHSILDIKEIRSGKAVFCEKGTNTLFMLPVKMLEQIGRNRHPLTKIFL